jgi:hypothetical protein
LGNESEGRLKKEGFGKGGFCCEEGGFWREICSRKVYENDNRRFLGRRSLFFFKS